MFPAGEVGEEIGVPRHLLGRFLTQNWRESHASLLVGRDPAGPARAWCPRKCFLGLGATSPPTPADPGSGDAHRGLSRSGSPWLSLPVRDTVAGLPGAP